MRTSSLLAPLLGLAAVASIAGAAPAEAATYVVTTTADTVAEDGACSLREAVDAANADAGTADCPADGIPGDDRIVVPAGTFTLTGPGTDDDDANASGDLDVVAGTGALTIAGAGRDVTVLDGAGRYRLINLVHGAAPTTVVRIEDLTLRHGAGTAGTAVFEATNTVARIELIRVAVRGCHGWQVIGSAFAALDLVEVEIATSAAQSIVRSRGGLRVVRSVFHGNAATDAVLDLPLNRSTTIESSTITGNAGRAVYLRAGDPDAYAVRIAHSTIVDNDVGLGGIAGEIEVRGTILHGNQVDCERPMATRGHNLVGDATACAATDASDVGGLDPRLDALAWNGGATPTRRPLAGSPARGRGTCADVVGEPVATDQRGVARPQGGACDIGAFEGGVVLVDVRTEPPGPVCPAGGAQVVMGEDDDDDGTLAEDEVDQAIPVCDGEDGAPGEGGAPGEDGAPGGDGAPTLVTSAPEPPGAACPAGGQQLAFGADDDRDGVLAPEEVDETLVICHGAGGEDGADGGGCAAAGGRASTGGALVVMLAVALTARRRRGAGPRR